MSTKPTAPVMGDYYTTQLERIGNPHTGAAPLFKLTHHTPESDTHTNWLSLNDDSATALVNWLNDHYNIATPVVAPVKRTTINRKYTHFCVSKATGKIVDGWEYADEYELSDIQDFYKQDMKDHDRLLKDYKLEMTVTLYKRGIDPYDSLNWGNN